MIPVDTYASSPAGEAVWCYREQEALSAHTTKDAFFASFIFVANQTLL